MNIFEIIGIFAGLSAAIPSIPQIIHTLKTKNVKGLSTTMFWIRVFGGVLWVIYGTYLHSWQMQFFNTFMIVCNIIMLVLIKKYKK